MKKTIFLSLLSLIAGLSRAQDSVCQRYNSFNAVNTVMTDHDTVWAGTDAGLVKQDLSGNILATYTPENSSLSNCHITALAIDQTGNVLVGTASHGLQRFDRHLSWTGMGTASLDAADFSTLCYEVTKILTDQDRIWVVVNNIFTPLYYFDGSSWTAYTSANSIIPSGAPIMHIEKDNNKVWMSGFTGANEPFFIAVSSGAWTMLDHTHGLPAGINGFQFTITPDHKIWMYSDRGPVSFDGSHYDSSYCTLPVGVYYHYITSDSAGHLWIDDLGGMRQLSGHTWVRQEFVSTISSAGYVNDAAFDYHGQLWVGAAYGMYRWAGSWQAFDRSDVGIGGGYPSQVMEDATGGLCIGSSTCLSRYAAGGWSSPLKAKVVLGMSKSPGGILYVATQDSGIYIMSPSGEVRNTNYIFSAMNIVAADDTTVWTAYYSLIKLTPHSSEYFSPYTDPGILGGYYHFTDRDVHGNIWFAGDSGVVKYDGHSFSSFTYTDIGVAPGFVMPYQLTHDRTGGMYVVTSAGMFYYDGNIWSSIAVNNDPLLPPATAMVDHNGDLWVGSEFSLYKRMGTTWTAEAPLFTFGGGVYSIAEDHLGNVWVASGFDLAKICDATGPNGIPENTATTTTLAYPNPADNTVYLHTGSQSDYPMSVELTDATGKSAGSYTVTGESVAISTSALSAGLYVASITTATHQHSQAKIVIAR